MLGLANGTGFHAPCERVLAPKLIAQEVGVLTENYASAPVAVDAPFAVFQGPHHLVVGTYRC